MHGPAAETVAQEGVPHGTMIEFTMHSEESKFYPGIARDAGTFGVADPADPAKMIVTSSRPTPWIRKVGVYVPKQYVAGRPLRFWSARMESTAAWRQCSIT